MMGTDRLSDLEVQVGDLNLNAKPSDRLASSAILTLPFDITSQIFILFVGQWSDFHDTGSGPLLLASVCKAWRAIALDLPPIWSHIEIYPTRTRWGAEQLLQVWLPRAGDHPLDLDIRRQNSEYNMFGILAPSSMQWRSIHLVLSSLPFWVVNEIGGRTPLLERVTLIREAPASPEWLERGPRITAFRDAPRLRSASLFHVYMDRIELPWTQLTWLEWCGSELELADLIKVLSHTSQLETLFVDTSHDPFFNLLYAPGIPSIRFEHLVSLTLQGRQLKLPLLAIAAPALKHLTISSTVNHNDLPHLLPFLARSGSLSLISLEAFLAFTAISALEAAATASEVRLTRVSWPTSDLAALFTRIRLDASFLPHVQTLALEQCFSPLPYSELADMLGAREGGECARLARFRFTRPRARSCRVAKAAGAGGQWHRSRYPGTQYWLRSAEVLCIMISNQK
ncbi:hypothetical protein B0H15DRAFT_868234 [Mycena belliarum]|uniref:F-box domain-containing protein n=1 Tax=Mycena belliarum TaxID=1033014 RepID=A0AAD6TPP3_9AGAR|nr:hypothetical protein B0H15DRAFT_868234 [Mycena belliae]